MRAIALFVLLPACSGTVAPRMMMDYTHTPVFGGEDARVSAREVADPRLDEARTEPDLAKRAEMLRPIAKDPYPAVARAARVELVRTLAELGRVAEMEEVAKGIEILEDVEGGDLLDTMAFALAEHGGDRDRALLLARRAVDVVEALRESGREKKGRSRTAWRRDLAFRKARYHDTLGWVLLKGGDARSAVKALEVAARGLPDDVRVQYHLGVALAETGRAGAAAEALAKAVAGDGPESPAAREALAAIAPDKEARIAAAETRLADRVRERATSNALDEEVPPLEAKDAAGDPIVATGPAVVLFWASWDEPSMHALRTLTALARDPAFAGVRIVSLSLDRAANGPAAAARNGVPFPVGLDPDRSDATRWRVRALPAAFVLDARGRVRYRNEGMVPGYQWLLKAQVESLGDGT